ncbi:MAG: DUF72 domain-containing protein [Candidatus Bathyarchaeota archaeon]|nr:DUF72 domain-containing protein [Candidatus Bathyarchaeota archaeon]
MSLIIGTSGWSYKEWVGPFYEKKTGMYTQYAKVFHTAEINSTFYRYPSEGLIAGLRRNAPPGFTFAAKLPKLITHDKWLRLRDGVEDDTDRFLELMRPLAEKLGPLLIQLRPKFNYDDHVGNLETYLESLPRNYEWAVEFRHKSWLRPETYDLLRKHNVAYTIVDEPLLPVEMEVTADFAYVRWHGHGEKLWYDYEYSEDQLEEWVPKVHEIKGKARRTYGYFNNHFRANAVKNAVEMLNILGEATPEQNMALEKITGYRETAARPVGVQPLTAYASDDEDLSVSDHIMLFTDARRLGRAEKITDEVHVTRSSNDFIEASLRNYYIEVDLDNKVIKHNCDDWRKGRHKKRMCKHLAKLFLTLPPGQSKRVLQLIWNDIDGWVFEE